MSKQLKSGYDTQEQGKIEKQLICQYLNEQSFVEVIKIHLLHASLRFGIFLIYIYFASSVKHSKIDTSRKNKRPEIRQFTQENDSYGAQSVCLVQGRCVLFHRCQILPRQDPEKRALEQPSERAQKPYNQRVTEAPSNLPKSRSQNQHSSNHEHSLEGKNRSPFSGDNDFCKAFDLTFLVLIFEKLLKPVLHSTATVEHVNTGVF